MAAAEVVTIDGLSDVDLGITLTAIPGAWAAPETAYPIINIPGQPGAVVASETPTIPARVNVVTASILEETWSDAETTIQALKDATSGRLCRIQFANQVGRAYYGIRQSMPADLFRTEQGPLGWLTVSVPFLCPDPYAIDDEEFTASGIANARVPVRIGSGPTYPEIILVGPTSGAITITPRKNNGESLGTLVLNFLDDDGETPYNLTASDFAIIRTIDGGEIWLSEAGTVRDALNARASGSTFPVFSPRDGNRALASYPTVETDKGSIVVPQVRRWE